MVLSNACHCCVASSIFADMSIGPVFPHIPRSYDSAHNGIRSRGAAALSSAVWTPHPMLQVTACCRPLALPLACPSRTDTSNYTTRMF
jgi:hypothetical protein